MAENIVHLVLARAQGAPEGIKGISLFVVPKVLVNADGSLNVPDRPIIPFIEGDGIGIDITPVMRKVVDAAVERAYGGARRIEWMEVYAGEKSFTQFGEWLIPDTLKAITHCLQRSSLNREGVARKL
jgi:hypothetical protein